MGQASTSWKGRLVSFLPERLHYILRTSIHYRRKMGRWPNLISPSDITEQIQIRKIWDRDPRLPRFADKVLVKEYVRETLGADWVIPTLWSGKKLPPMAERHWQPPFVIKVNSGCGWNIFIRTAADLDWANIEATCNRWMATTYGAAWGEWLYSKIEPQILIEKWIEPDQPLPKDYKFLVFHGKVRCCYIVTDRASDQKITFFSPNWQRIEGQAAIHPPDMRDIPPPASLPALIAAAEKLAADIDFVRVDLYDGNGRPLFGEMTFYPGSGYYAFPPKAFGQQLLEWWRHHETAPGPRMSEITATPAQHPISS